MMETLIPSSSPHPLLLQSSKKTAFSSSSSSRSPALLSTKKPHQFVSFHHKLHYSNVSSSLQLKPAISSVSCKSSFSESSFVPHSESNAGKTEIPSQGKTVRVKFQLIKKCEFGQQFLVVGDDPIFGEWDPSKAIPLNWSERHLWTAELDVPIDRTIQFKFILKYPSGEVTWQPGPNRVFQTWETNNMIVVFEDWDDLRRQFITEVEPVPNPNAPDDTMAEMEVMEPLANSNTEEPVVVAFPVSSVEIMSYPEAEQTDKELFKSNNNVKRAAAETNGVEVATEDNNKSEAITKNQKKEEPGKPDKEQVCAGDEKDCQSTNAELTEVLDFPSAEDVAKRNWDKFDGSTNLDHLKNPKEFESTSDDSDEE